MDTPEFISALMDPGAYGHPCGEVQLVETHISWVFLTGDYAYKVKKPVQFNFVDFSTLERRAYYCEEEVRCNRSFSPELYIGVVTINQDDEGRYHVAGPGRVVESAVKMRQFPGAQQLDSLLAAGALEAPTMRRFGLDLADQHAQLPRLKGDDDEVDTRVCKPVLDNFRTLGPLRASRRHEILLNRLEADSRSRSDGGPGAVLAITADHGNADEMRDASGGVVTRHSLNVVPFLLLGSPARGRSLREGVLADVTPTLLGLLGEPLAEGMSGRSLLER